MDLLQKIVLRFALTMTIFYECCFAYWLFTTPSASLVIASVMHVILVLCFVYFLHRLSEQFKKPNESLIYTAFVLTLVLPVYGMVGMTCLFILTNLIKIENYSFLENDEIFLPSKHKMHLRNHSRKPWQIEKDELDVSSFRDVFRSGDRELEEIVIEKLSKTMTRQSVDILKEVLATSTSDTKILAATALTEIEGKIINGIDELRNKIKDEPNDIQSILDLARIYDLYCFLGVLDSSSISMYQEMAIEKYEQHVMINPKPSPGVVMEYGRILYNAGQDAAAIENLNEAARLAPVNPSPKIWLAEVYFESKNYEKVVDICHDILTYENLPDRSKEVADLWVNTESAEETVVRIVNSDD